MAKTSLIVKDKQKRELSEKGKFPRTKLHNRCNICGRPRGYYRFFGVCRLCLRKLAHEGVLPGVRKASW
jgi:small subunit ribosomal protein S14